MMRWMTAGESHGRCLTTVMEGVPAGLSFTTDMLADELRRRRLGYGRGTRQLFEQDEVTITAGVRHGLTLGSPLSITIGNSEWPKWDVVMSADPVPAESLLAADDVNAPRELARNRPLTRPRPGHADLAGMTKYGWSEARPILERASARETAARTAAGTVAKALLREVAGVEVYSHTVALGGAGGNLYPECPTEAQLRAVDDDPVRSLGGTAGAAMVAAVEQAKDAGETLGGVIEVIAERVPVGLGSHVHWDRKLDARLAGAVMSIPAIKGVEIGQGWQVAGLPGSQAHDELVVGSDGVVCRETLRAGGIEGGISIGGRVVVRAAMKPISTVPRPLRTIDVATGEPAVAHHQRSDVCAVPAAGVVAETMVALVLAEALLEKFGGDHVAEVRRNLLAFVDSVPEEMRVQ